MNVEADVDDRAEALRPHRRATDLDAARRELVVAPAERVERVARTRRRRGARAAASPRRTPSQRDRRVHGAVVDAEDDRAGDEHDRRVRLRRPARVRPDPLAAHGGATARDGRGEAHEERGVEHLVGPTVAERHAVARR